LLKTSERVAQAEQRPRRASPSRRAADVLAGAAVNEVVAKPVAAYADTEPFYPDKPE
jgi:hypothetical protein